MFQETFELDGKMYYAREEEVTRMLCGEEHTNTILKVYDTTGSDGYRDINPNNRGMVHAPRIPNDVKVGDKAIHERHGYGGHRIVVVEVTRVTNTQLVAGDKRYMRRDGYEYGAGNGFSSTGNYLYGYSSDYIACTIANNKLDAHSKVEEKIRRDWAKSVEKVAKNASLDQLEMALRILQGMSLEDFNARFGGQK